jgi:hypothetical protein
MIVFRAVKMINGIIAVFDMGQKLSSEKKDAPHKKLKEKFKFEGLTCLIISLSLPELFSITSIANSRN